FGRGAGRSPRAQRPAVHGAGAAIRRRVRRGRPEGREFLAGTRDGRRMARSRPTARGSIGAAVRSGGIASVDSGPTGRFCSAAAAPLPPRGLSSDLVLPRSPEPMGLHFFEKFLRDRITRLGADYGI